MQVFLVPCKEAEDRKTGTLGKVLGLGDMEVILPSKTRRWSGEMALVLLYAFEASDEGDQTLHLHLVDSHGRRQPFTGISGAQGDAIEVTLRVPPGAGGHAEALKFPGLQVSPGEYRWQIHHNGRVVASWPFTARVQRPGEGRALLEGTPE